MVNTINLLQNCLASVGTKTGTYKEMFQHYSAYYSILSDNTEMVSSSANMTTSFKMFQEKGNQLFVISKDLREILSNTDINVPPSLLKMPYDSIAIQLDEKSHIFVTESENRLQVVSVRHKGTAESLQIRFVKFDSNSESDLCEDQSYKSVVNTLPKAESAILIKDIETAFNTIIYLQSQSGISEKRTGSRKKIDWSNRKSVKKASKPMVDYTYISPASYHFENCTDSNRTINKTFWVRGHWRKQPFGKNGEDRKLIFIKPFIKGTDTPSQRSYRVR